MADIMQQCCDNGYFGSSLVGLKPTSRRFSFDNPNQLSRGMKNPDRMRKTRVSGPGKDEFGHAKLFDPTKTLEFRRVDQSPGKLVQRAAGLEYNQTVDGISKPLGSWFCHRIEACESTISIDSHWLQRTKAFLILHPRSRRSRLLNWSRSL
jgi:hypothetical protein